jgi:hypothetical protein
MWGERLMVYMVENGDGGDGGRRQIFNYMNNELTISA